MEERQQVHSGLRTQPDRNSGAERRLLEKSASGTPSRWLHHRHVWLQVSLVRREAVHVQSPGPSSPAPTRRARGPRLAGAGGALGFGGSEAQLSARGHLLGACPLSPTCSAKGSQVLSQTSPWRLVVRGGLGGGGGAVEEVCSARPARARRLRRARACRQTRPGGRPGPECTLEVGV